MRKNDRMQAFTAFPVCAFAFFNIYVAPTLQWPILLGGFQLASVVVFGLAYPFAGHSKSCIADLLTGVWFSIWLIWPITNLFFVLSN